MKMMICLASLLLVFCVDTIYGNTLGVCSGAGYCAEADFKTLGCYKDVEIDRALPNYIYNERDPTTSNFGGRFIEWYNWNNYLPGFTCRCAAKAKALGYDIFGVQFWGECWAGHKSANTWNKHNTINNCFGYNYQACQSNERFCSGANYTNMIYEIVDLSCSVNFESVGCFKDQHGNNRPLPDYVLNDRDSYHVSFSGTLIDWVNWDTYMPDFACRCAKKAQELGHTYFGTQFYGECWTGNNAQNTFGIDGPSTSCIDRCYKPCKKNEKRCVGEQFSNYVYHIKQAVCEFSLTEAGCYVEDPQNRVLSDLVWDATNPTSSSFYGELLGERAWNDFFPEFLCKCARIASSRGHTVIGVSNKGVCYSSLTNNNYDTLGVASSCGQGSSSVPCVSGSKKCAGLNENTNYVYTLS